MEGIKTDSIILDDMLIVSEAPHIRSNESVRRIMLDVIIALVPAMIGSIYFFGMNAVRLILITIISAVLFEAGTQNYLKKKLELKI